jgi:hypothetical protein
MVAMAFFEDSSDLKALRGSVSKVLRDCCDPSCLAEVPFVVTAGSGPFCESEFDDLLGEICDDELDLFGITGSVLDAADASESYEILIVLGRRDFSPAELSDLIGNASGGFVLRIVPQEALLEAMLIHGASGPICMADIEVDASEIIASHPAFAWLEDRFGWSSWVDHEVPDWASVDGNSRGEDQDSVEGAAVPEEEEEYEEGEFGYEDEEGEADEESDFEEEDEDEDEDEDQDQDQDEDEDEESSSDSEADFADEWDGEGLSEDEGDDPCEEGKYHEDIMEGETKDEDEQEEERRWLDGEEGEDEEEEDEEEELDADLDEAADDDVCDEEVATNLANPSVWSSRPQAEQDRFIADLRQFGMLRAFGYTVGAKAPPDLTRRGRLRRALVEDLPPGLGQSYIAKCGPPNSLARLKKMADSIATFARNAKRKRSSSMAESIRHWEMDLAWMKQEWYRPGMGFDWPGTYVG